MEIFSKYRGVDGELQKSVLNSRNLIFITDL